MTPTEELTILLADLDDVRQVLSACIVYFQAADLSTAQVEFRAPRPSPLTTELERVKERFDSYLGDYLLARHEATLDEDEDEGEELVEESELEAEEASEDITEASEELSSTPLGSFTPPKQKGRRLSPEELASASDSDEVK